jgi:hypothetical protein
MFGYGKTIRRLRADSNTVVIPPLHGYDLTVDFNKCKQKYSRKIGQMLKFAACFVLVTVLFGLAVIPSNIIPRQSNTSANVQGGSAAATHSFTLAAYAAETNTTGVTDAGSVDDASKTVLKPDVQMQLPAGKFTQDKSNYDYTVVDSSGVAHYAYYNYEGNWSFKCTGDNIDSITYVSSNGILDYFDRDMYQTMEKSGDLYICKIPLSLLGVSSDAGFDTITQVFQQKLANGQLDEYKNKYFGGKNINLNDYSAGLNIGQDKIGYLTISQILTGPPKYMQQGGTVTAKPDVYVRWHPSLETWDTVNTNPNFTDYASLRPDTVTVTAKFTDGQTLTKTVIISYNADGSISATLQGN